MKPKCGKDREPLFGIWMFSGGTWTATTGIAGSVCRAEHAWQDLQGASISQFSLKLDERQARAKVTLFATSNGTSAAGNGRGTYKAIVRGTWQPAP